MMNKDDERYESTVEGRRKGMEIMDTPDDRKPAAKVIDTQQSVMRPGALPSPLMVVKRKRKSPDKPWKKPPDMPKRPLSAYNIFFRDERERLLGAGSEGKQSTDTESGTATPGGTGEVKASGKKSKSKSGIGFANLAKTIANRWNELGEEIRAPYEAIAAAEKKKYDESVAEWRVKQAAKKKALALEKKEAGEEQKVNIRATAPNLYPSDRSLGSFSDSSNPYPTEWFHSGPEHDMSEREDTSTSRTSVPPIVETPHGMSYEGRSPGGSMPSQSWRYDSASYYQYPPNVYEGSGTHMRYSPDVERGSYVYPSDESLRASSGREFSPVYRDYYHHSQQSTYTHQASRRHNDMRMSRTASLPPTRHGESSISHHTMQRTLVQPPDEIDESLHHEISRNVAQFRSSRTRQFRQQYANPPSGRGSSSMVYPRSSSMPFVQHTSTSSGSRRRRVHPVDYTDPMPPPQRFDDMMMTEDSYRSLPPGYGRSQQHQMMEMGVMPSRRQQQQYHHHHQQQQHHHRHTTPPSLAVAMEGDMVSVPGVEGTMMTGVTAGTTLPSTILPTGQSQQVPQQSTTTTATTTTAVLPSPTNNNNEESIIVQTSLHSLNESLDEDAISFITSMKYHQ